MGGTGEVTGDTVEGLAVTVGGTATQRTFTGSLPALHTYFTQPGNIRFSGDARTLDVRVGAATDEIDPVTLDLLKPSIYSESVWEARKHRAITEGRQATIDWIVVVNRMAVAAARNRQRLEDRMEKLSRRVGFRIGPGLRDRVIYRELFPFGLTVADLSNEVRPVAVSLAHVAARQEMRNLMLALGLDGSALDAPLDAAA